MLDQTAEREGFASDVNPQVIDLQRFSASGGYIVQEFCTHSRFKILKG